MPDFWVNEATNVLCSPGHRKRLTPEEATAGLAQLQALVVPTPTGAMGLQDAALEIGPAVYYSVYHTIYAAFTRAGGETHLVVAHDRFAVAMARHTDPGLARLLLPLAEWAARSGR